MTLKESFPDKRYIFLPVVHVKDKQQALRNALKAKIEGADGVFLINHQVSDTELIIAYEEVRETMPNFWIGLNFLGMGGLCFNITPKGAQGLWVDNAGISEGEDPVGSARDFAAIREESGWQGVYFGGVAFKYQEEVSDVAKAARLALPFVDVVTTSGPGTGYAADIGKIRLMKEAIGDHPLAIASGITPENVSSYMPYADCFLVATGISDSDSELNPALICKLSKALGR